jgi:hypothetical protein
MQDHQGSQLPETFSDLLRAAQIMKDFPRSWCVCGGWAIDLFINRLTRPHKDVDFAIWRRDQLALHAYLTAQGWSLEKAVDGQLMPWPEGEFIELPFIQFGVNTEIYNQISAKSYSTKRMLISSRSVAICPSHDLWKRRPFGSNQAFRYSRRRSFYSTRLITSRRRAIGAISKAPCPYLKLSAAPGYGTHWPQCIQGMNGSVSCKSGWAD